jgi:hypothetical protein
MPGRWLEPGVSWQLIYYRVLSLGNFVGNRKISYVNSFLPPLVTQLRTPWVPPRIGKLGKAFSEQHGVSQLQGDSEKLFCIILILQAATYHSDSWTVLGGLCHNQRVQSQEPSRCRGRVRLASSVLHKLETRVLLVQRRACVRPQRSRIAPGARS